MGTRVSMIALPFFVLTTTGSPEKTGLVSVAEMLPLVVLKVLKHELAHEHEFRSMFMNEARLAARLNHPNVVQTNEVLEVVLPESRKPA